MPSVTFEHVRKLFHDVTVVEDFNLVVEDGELLVLVGGSGSGKSTILRMVAGLEDVTSGSIRIDQLDVTPLPPRERDVAMVFQDYGLYPHMTVRENLSLGLRLRNTDRREIDRLSIYFPRKKMEAAGVEPASERPVTAELYMRSRPCYFARGN